MVVVLHETPPPPYRPQSMQWSFGVKPALAVGKIVSDIIFDLDRFYKPEKRQPKLHTSTGTCIYYPMEIRKSDNKANLNSVKNKSFVHRNRSSLSSKAEESNPILAGNVHFQPWMYDTNLRNLIHRHYGGQQSSCYAFLTAEKLAYFEPEWRNGNLHQFARKAQQMKSKLRSFATIYKSHSYPNLYSGARCNLVGVGCSGYGSLKSLVSLHDFGC